MTIADLKEHNLLLLECITGSRAFGLEVPTSDTDIKGVYFLPKKQFYGLNYIPQISNESNDVVYYEIGRFVDLLLKNNPNMLELLATPDDKILFKHPLMDLLKVEYFLSKKCKDTFGGYAFTQIKKARGLNKKIANPMTKEKKSVLDFCFVLQGQGSIPIRQWLEMEQKIQEQIGLVNIPHFKNTFGLYYDLQNQFEYKGIIKKESNTNVILSSIPKGEKALTYLHFHEDAFIKYCKEYTNYWDWVSKRNESRYQNNIHHGKNYDSKNMMHTFRLLDMAYEILSQGEVIVKRPNRQELLDIRNGKWSYEELIEMAEKKMQKVQHVYSKSQLQEEPNTIEALKILVKIRETLYA